MTLVGMTSETPNSSSELIPLPIPYELPPQPYSSQGHALSVHTILWRHCLIHCTIWFNIVGTNVVFIMFYFSHSCRCSLVLGSTI